MAIEHPTHKTDAQLALKLDLTRAHPDFFYVLEHPLLGAKKVGITNGNRKHFRLKRFQQAGWNVLALHQCEDGRKILELETLMLHWVRKDLKLPVYLSLSEMPQTGGFTETFEGEAISNVEFLMRVEECAAQLGIGRATNGDGARWSR